MTDEPEIEETLNERRLAKKKPTWRKVTERVIITIVVLPFVFIGIVLFMCSVGR